MPSFDPKTWRLDDRRARSSTPISLDYHDLLSLPKVEQVSTFHCVTGWTVKNVHWGGVRLTDVLALAKPQPRARTRSSSSRPRCPTSTT